MHVNVMDSQCYLVDEEEKVMCECDEVKRLAENSYTCRKVTHKPSDTKDGE